VNFISTIEEKEIKDFEETINRKIPIPLKWKRHILDVFKTQANNIEDLEYLPDLIKAWAWITRPQPSIWTLINYLNRYPATTPFLLATSYVFDEGIESEETSSKDIQKFAARFRRAIYHLYHCGILTCRVVTPEEVGLGNITTTIWITPFAKEKDIEKTRQFYMNMGGNRGARAPKKSKTPKDVAVHNAKVQVYALLNKYTSNSHMFDYYQCPKNHSEGLKRTRGVRPASKKKKLRIFCTECNRRLIEIPYEEFMDIKEKQILKSRGLSR
jgi:hypothetical protein